VFIAVGRQNLMPSCRMSIMKLPFKKRRRPRLEPEISDPGLPRVEDLPDAVIVESLAAEHLPDGVRERWMGLLRPAVRLVPTTDQVLAVARLGGLPRLPAEISWPYWDGHGPLSYIGELRCDRLAQFELDIPMPKAGRLLFFYFDGSYDNFSTTIGTWDASTLKGAQAVHIPDDGPFAPHPTPEGLAIYPERSFAGRQIVTAPGWGHPDLREAFMKPGQDDRSFMSHPAASDAFNEALHERHSGPVHQIGGYAEPVQGPIEYEVANAALANQVPHGDPRLYAEARRWELLFQVDSDDDLGMMWGDVGVLYWMARPEDLANDDFTQLSFTWQCS